MDVSIDKKLVLTATTIIVIAVIACGFAFAGWGQYLINQYNISTGGAGQQVQPGASTYTQGLTVNFKLNDPAAGALVTADVRAGFYNAGANPLSGTTIDTSITSGAYSSPVWQATLDNGNYEMLISDTNTGSEIFYPSLTTVFVPGTNTTSLNGDTVVTLQPAVTQLVERATPTLTTTIKAYNTTTHLYDQTQTELNFTSVYTKWDIKVAIDLAGIQGQKIEAGRIYLPVISGITYNTASINGVAIALQSDLVGTADGVSGQYISFNDLAAGQTVNLEFRVQKAGAGPVDASPVIVTLYEDYVAQNTDYRWWTDATSSITVEV